MYFIIERETAVKKYVFLHNALKAATLYVNPNDVEVVCSTKGLSFRPYRKQGSSETLFTITDKEGYSSENPIYAVVTDNKAYWMIMGSIFPYQPLRKIR